MIAHLEEEKESLIASMKAAGTPDKIRPVAERALDRVLLKSSDELPDGRQKAAAGAMIGVLKASLPLCDTVGEVRVWRRDEGARGKSRAGIFACAGGMCLLVPVLAACLPSGTFPELHPAVSVICSVCAAVLFFLAGREKGHVLPGRSAGGTEMTECVPDAERIYGVLRAAILTADQNLKAIASEEAWAARNSAEETDSVLSPQEVQLYSDLLEALYSGDAEYAFGRLEEIRYYLHGRQVEVVDCSGENAKYFDRMPSSVSGTLRPALVSGGKLLKKGLASA